jgi:hypothetical protein
LTPDLANDGSAPPRRSYRRIVGLVVLVAGSTWIAEIASSAKKETVAIYVLLPGGVRGLRLDVQRRAEADARLIEHLEWSYPAQSPSTQEAALDLRPGRYSVTVHALGAGRDPEPVELKVDQGEPASLSIDLRQP